MLAAEAAKMKEKAQAAIENGEAKAQTAVLEAAAVQTPVSEVQKVSGQAIKETWLAVLMPGITEEAALSMIVNAIVTEKRSDLLALLKIDTAPRGALNKLAAALKEAMRVPGYAAQAQHTLSGSRK